MFLFYCYWVDWAIFFIFCYFCLYSFPFYILFEYPLFLRAGSYVFLFSLNIFELLEFVEYFIYRDGYLFEYARGWLEFLIIYIRVPFHFLYAMYFWLSWSLYLGNLLFFGWILYRLQILGFWRFLSFLFWLCPFAVTVS